jgi:hypothetical protein
MFKGKNLANLVDFSAELKIQLNSKVGRMKEHRASHKKRKKLQMP